MRTPTYVEQPGLWHTELPARQTLNPPACRPPFKSRLRQKQPASASLRTTDIQKKSHSGVIAVSGLADWTRRGVFGCGCAALATLVLPPGEAPAIDTVAKGLRRYVDRLDGYSFVVPPDWTAVTSSGNEVFFRNPFNVNENLFVALSSPSSRKYDNLDTLGSPRQAAQQTLKQYLDEFGTTRLGVRRDGEVLTASSRTGADGRQYYDIQVRLRSYASRNQLSVYQRNVDSGMQLEWDRRFVTVLGTANRRLYEFRLQAANSQYAKSEDTLLGIAHSFECNEVEK